MVRVYGFVKMKPDSSRNEPQVNLYKLTLEMSTEMLCFKHIHLPKGNCYLLNAYIIEA